MAAKKAKKARKPLSTRCARCNGVRKIDEKRLCKDCAKYLEKNPRAALYFSRTQEF